MTDTRTLHDFMCRVRDSDCWARCVEEGHYIASKIESVVCPKLDRAEQFKDKLCPSGFYVDGIHGCCADNKFSFCDKYDLKPKGELHCYHDPAAHCQQQQQHVSHLQQHISHLRGGPPQCIRNCPGYMAVTDQASMHQFICSVQGSTCWHDCQGHPIALKIGSTSCHRPTMEADITQAENDSSSNSSSINNNHTMRRVEKEVETVKKDQQRQHYGEALSDEIFHSQTHSQTPQMHGSVPDEQISQIFEGQQQWLRISWNKFELVVAVCVLAGAVVVLVLIQSLEVVKHCGRSGRRKRSGSTHTTIKQQDTSSSQLIDEREVTAPPFVQML